MRTFKLFSDDRALFNILEPYLSDDNCGSLTLNQATEEVIPTINKDVINVLDLGCGDGRSRSFFGSLDRNIKWTGCDIESSPEVKSRNDHSGVVNFNGIDIPFEDNSFDYIYSNQVFEHVRFPDSLLRSVERVLSPGGIFAFSVSHLEPYHSYSIFNFTPYGAYRVVTEAGLEMLKIHTVIDCFRLIKRRFENRQRTLTEFLNSPSPLEEIIEKSSLSQGLSVKEINYLKLLYSAEFVAISKKSDV